MQQIGYIRVSSVDQNTGRQLDGITLDKTFMDRCSGKDTDRPELRACLDFMRAADTLHVHSIDRLARNMQDLLALVSGLLARGITIRFHKNNLTFTPGTTDPASSLLLNMLGAVAQFERDMIKERQREGIALAKAAGKYTGRKPSLTARQAEDLCRRTGSGEKVAALAKEYGVSRQTIYDYLKAHAQA